MTVFTSTLRRRASALAQGAIRSAVFLAPLLLRVALATPFLRSGLTRWDAPFVLAPSSAYLFESLFQLHIGTAAYALPFPIVTAYITAVLEILLPILLLLGLGTRLAALGLLAMTFVIQLVAPEGWANFHLAWSAMAVALIAMGAGPVSLDRALAPFFPRPSLG